jgi:methionyl-tRNA synthetase
VLRLSQGARGTSATTAVRCSTRRSRRSRTRWSSARGTWRFAKPVTFTCCKPRLQDRIRAWLDEQADFPALTRSIALKHLDEGLIDRGITRDLAWGVPVVRRGFPRSGFEDKVFYVWFDAPIEYIAATVEWADASPVEEARDWRRWWRLDAGATDVRYVQVMGKDNVAFHTVSFPATVLGSEEPWKLVDMLKSFNWLNWYGGKFSTSGRRGVFMDAALEIQPADVWRWWLTANAPEGSDAAFTWEQFQAVVNKDLADVLGNFVNRIVKFAEARFDGVVPAGGEPGPLEAQLQGRVAERLTELTGAMEALEVRRSAQALRALWVVGNEYLQEAAPWTAIKTDRERAGVVVRTGLNLVRLFAAVSAPVLPFTAAKIAATVGEVAPLAWPGEDLVAELDRLAPGTPVAAPEVLFRKIEDAQLVEWAARFGGAEAAS